MKINYSLTSENFLNYQLYTANRSDLIKKKRIRSWLIVPAVYVLLSFIAYFVNNSIVGVSVLLFFTLAWLIFYPTFGRWRYKSHYKKHIEQNYTQRINIDSELEILDNSILLTDQSGESVINSSAVESIIELPKQYHIKMKTNVSIIIPKTAVADRILLIEKTENLNASYIDETDWEWK